MPAVQAACLQAESATTGSTKEGFMAGAVGVPGIAWLAVSPVGLRIGMGLTGARS
jgi:hypothetical protein